MSVTPDFVGQVYKDTNTGNIWRANSTTPGDWTLEVQNMQETWTPTNVKQGEILGWYAEGGSLPGILTQTFLGTSSLQGFYLKNLSGDVTSIEFPNLLSIDTGFVTTNGGIIIASIATLQSVIAPLVTTIGGILDIGQCANLSTVTFPVLATLGYFDISENDSIASLSFPELLQLNNGALTAYSNPSLVSLSVPKWTPYNGDNISCSGNALNVASVDHILARCVANAAFVSGTVGLSGGTNAHPSSTAPGSDYATLVARGVVVNINP